MTSRQGALLFLIPLVIILSLTFSLSLVSATLDSVTPEQNWSTNAQNITFEYYVSLPNIQQCTLTLSKMQSSENQTAGHTTDNTTENYTDTTIDNGAFNTFTVLNLEAGTYEWSVTCLNTTTSETTETSSFIIDRSPPVLTIIEPANATIVNDTLRLTVTDNQDANLTCTVYDANTSLTSFNAQRNTLTTLDLGLTEERTYHLKVACADDAGNIGLQQRTFTYQPAPPQLFLTIATNKQSYALGENVVLTIDALENATINLEVCPNETGFVQCYTPLINNNFPQVLILPFANKTGSYLVEGTATYGNQVVQNVTSYTVENTMSVTITPDREPALDEVVTLTSEVHGGLGNLTYAWTLHNGTTENTSSVTISYDEPGNFTEELRVTDAFGNTVTENFTARIKARYDIIVVVNDAGKPLPGATVQFESKTNGDSVILQTGTDGRAFFTLEEGSYTLFVSKEGYDYILDDVKVEQNETRTVSLQPLEQRDPIVTITAPGDGTTLKAPVTITFTVEHDLSVTCHLSYAPTGSRWLEQSSTVKVEPDAAGKGQGEFTLTNLEEKEYRYLISCEDTDGFIGESPEQTFTVDNAVNDTAGESKKNSASNGGAGENGASGTPSATLGVGWGEDPLEVIDRAYAAYDSFNAEQRQLADLLGWERLVKEQKRAIEHAQRDKDAVKFRRDLSDEERQQKIREYDTRIATAQKHTPLDLAVLGSKTKLVNLKEEDIQNLAAEIIKLKGYPVTPAAAARFLSKLQQGFSKEVTVFRARILFADNTEKEISLVSNAFTYNLARLNDALQDVGGLSGKVILPTSTEELPQSLTNNFVIYESLPEGMDDVNVIDENGVRSKDAYTVLRENPPVLELHPAKHITYYVERDIPVETLLSGKSLLLKKLSTSEVNKMTGGVVGVTLFNWKLSLVLTLILALVVFLVGRLHLLRHLRFLFYAESGKKGLHALRTVLNDGHAQLEGGDLERAMMRYKEAKLAYEQLNQYAKNEALPDLLRLHDALDDAYFQQLVTRITTALDEGRLSDAIDDYARLEGTFDHLSSEKQQAVVLLVQEIARKIEQAAQGAPGGSPRQAASAQQNRGGAE